MPDKEKTAMETAICSSITRAAGLGDTFWRADLRSVAVMAMSSDERQSLNKPLSKGKSVTPGMHFIFCFHVDSFYVILFVKDEWEKEKKKKKRRHCMHDNDSPYLHGILLTSISCTAIPCVVVVVRVSSPSQVGTERDGTSRIGVFIIAR